MLATQLQEHFTSRHSGSTLYASLDFGGHVWLSDNAAPNDGNRCRRAPSQWACATLHVTQVMLLAALLLGPSLVRSLSDLVPLLLCSAVLWSKERVCLHAPLSSLLQRRDLSLLKRYQE
ncbi:hypothetical protein OPQ81_010038 [Rhizoctonia solani]|nr:hypothetical protein OPQ81_010038 [Rhizoctonia solani]